MARDVTIFTSCVIPKNEISSESEFLLQYNINFKACVDLTGNDPVRPDMKKTNVTTIIYESASVTQSQQ
jgi:hypothetical protein